MNPVATAVCWVVVCAALVAVLVVVGRRSDPPLRYLLYAQAAYWSVSYVARPAFLLVVGPRPRANDALADARLAIGGYGGGIARVAGIVALGLGCFVLAVVTARGRPTRGAPRAGWRTVWRFAITCYAVGWVCRIALLVHVVNPLTATVSGAAPVAVGLCYLAVDWSTVSTTTRRAVLACCVAGELAYSVAAESKTPALTVALFFFIAHAGRLRGARTAVLSVVAGGAGLAVFTVLQSLKASPGASRDLAVVDATYPLATRPLLPVLRRFDLFSAATDASFVPTGQWLDAGRFGARLLGGTVPWLVGGPYVSAGVRWAREVRAYTIPLNGSTVSLADGFIAEGWAVAGVVGVAGEAAVVALATVLVARALGSRAPFLAVLAIGLLTRPALFERGVLGLGEALGEAVQVSVVLTAGWLVWEYAVTRGWQHRPALSPPGPAAVAPGRRPEVRRPELDRPRVGRPV